MKFSKKNLVASVVSLIMVSAVMAEESAKSWDKIVMAGIGIPLARHKVEIGGEKKNLNSQGGGLFTEYVTIEKETNLSLVLNGTEVYGGSSYGYHNYSKSHKYYSRS